MFYFNADGKIFLRRNVTAEFSACRNRCSDETLQAVVSRDAYSGLARWLTKAGAELFSLLPAASLEPSVMAWQLQGSGGCLIRKSMFNVWWK